MSEFDTLNFAEHSYERRAEGRLRVLKILMLVGYLVFVGAYFLFCYLTRIIPLFALMPVFLWILVFFTWRYVSFDYYYTFQSGRLELGTIRSNKKGRKKSPKITLTVKDAIRGSLYTEEVAKELSDVRRIYDFSATVHSTERIVLVFQDAKGKYAVIFEGTAQAARMIAAYCPEAKSLKSVTFSK